MSVVVTICRFLRAVLFDKIIRSIFMDFLRYFNVPQDVNKLYKTQHLLINMAYLAGTIPFRFDYNTGKLVPIDSTREHFRWYGSTTITLLVKLLLISSLIKDIYLENVRFTYAPDIMRMVITSGFACYGLMDLHTAYKKTEIVTAFNRSQDFYQRFECKILIRNFKIILITLKNCPIGFILFMILQANISTSLSRIHPLRKVVLNYYSCFTSLWVFAAWDLF